MVRCWDRSTLVGNVEVKSGFEMVKVFARSKRGIVTISGSQGSAGKSMYDNKAIEDARYYLHLDLRSVSLVYIVTGKLPKFCIKHSSQCF